MHYSLQNRFRGALVGAALGEVLGFQCQTHRQQTSSSLSWQWLEQWGWQPLEIMPSWSYGRVIVSGIRQLIECQRWDVEGSLLRAGLMVDREVMTENSRRLLDQMTVPNSPSASLIVMLPIALYFHDDLPQLRYQLQQAIAVWHSTDRGDELLVVALTAAYAIALALHHQPRPYQLNLDLITNLIDDLELSQQHSKWAETLTQVADCIVQGRGLRSLVSMRSTEPVGSTALEVAIVLGSVLNTPDDFRLAVLQVARLSSHPRWACALVGALSGAYNGITGLPLQWRSALHHYSAQTSTLAALWGVPSEEGLVQLADQLLAVWAGIYQVSGESFDLLGGATRASSLYRAIAAPDVIRPR